MRGQRLCVKTNRRNFEGIFYSMDAFHTVMTMTDVVLQPSGEKIEGFCSVYKSDIISVHVVVDIAFAEDSLGIGDAVKGNLIPKDARTDAIHSLVENHMLITIVGDLFRKTVADLMVTELRCRQLPGCLRTLPECLNMYALVPAHFIYRPEIGEGYAGLESPQWKKRPLPMELEIGPVKNSVFLLQLQATT